MSSATNLSNPKYAPIAASTSGNNELLAGAAGIKYRVHAIWLVAGTAGNLYFTSDASGTVIFGGSTNKIVLPQGGVLSLPYSPAGWFETTVAHDLVMNASSTGPFSGGIVYSEVS